MLGGSGETIEATEPICGWDSKMDRNKSKHGMKDDLSKVLQRKIPKTKHSKTPSVPTAGRIVEKTVVSPTTLKKNVGSAVKRKETISQRVASDALAVPTCPGLELYVNTKIVKLQESNPTWSHKECRTYIESKWRNIDGDHQAKYKRVALKKLKAKKSEKSVKPKKDVPTKREKISSEAVRTGARQDSTIKKHLRADSGPSKPGPRDQENDVARYSVFVASRTKDIKSDPKLSALPQKERLKKLKAEWHLLTPVERTRYDDHTSGRHAIATSNDPPPSDDDDDTPIDIAAAKGKAPDSKSNRHALKKRKAVARDTATSSHGQAPETMASGRKKQRTLTDMLSFTSTKAKMDDLTPEQKERLVKDRERLRWKQMTKREKEAFRQAEKAKRAEERAKEQKKRSEQRKKENERQKKARVAAAARNKAREDLDEEVVKESAPLPPPERIRCRVDSDDVYFDIMMVAECINTFTKAMPNDRLNGLTPALLEGAVLKDDGFSRISDIAACLIIALLEVNTGSDNCEVPTPLLVLLRDLPVNLHTASEVLRLYLVQTGFSNFSDDGAGIIDALAQHELASLPAKDIVCVLAYLTHQLFSNGHVMDLLEDARDAIKDAKKKLLEVHRTVARERKVASRAVKEGVDMEKEIQEKDAELAELLAREEASGARRRTRRNEESAEVKALREAREEVERQLTARVRAEEELEQLTTELAEQKLYLREKHFGYDRNHAKYFNLQCAQGLFVMASDGRISRYASAAAVDALIKALNDRGMREKQLKAELRKHYDGIVSRLECADAVTAEQAFAASVEQQHVEHDIETLKGVGVDLIDFHSKIRDGGFGVPEEGPWRENLDGTPTAAQAAHCLLELEEHIDLRYLQEPLGKQRTTVDEELEATEHLMAWRAYGSSVTSASQVSLLYELLYESIRWDKSAKNIKCKICRRANAEDKLLLCDGCDHGFHMYCLKPKLFTIPEDDWFCKACKPSRTSERDVEVDTSTRSAKRRAAAALRRTGHSEEESDDGESGESAVEQSDNHSDDAGDDNEVNALCFVCSGGGEVLCCDTCTRVYHLECAGLHHTPRGEWSCQECKAAAATRPSRSRRSTRRKTTGRRRRRSSTSDEESDVEEDGSYESENDDDDDESDDDDSEVTTGTVTARGRFHGRSGMMHCEEIWKDLRRHQDAWPFLEPVDATAVPDYYHVVKDPVDLSMIKLKLDSVGYLDVDKFADDVRLMFDNCASYNPHGSAAAAAGRVLSEHFEDLFKSHFGRR
eukprot:m.835238 g.835238  ORF g.835238 m.835238 type:complete len:1257 (+) comp23453_c0_seq4:506-4276(+)